MVLFDGGRAHAVTPFEDLPPNKYLQGGRPCFLVLCVSLIGDVARGTLAPGNVVLEVGVLRIRRCNFRRQWSVGGVFEGERYSLVWFTLMGHEKATSANRDALKGAVWPTAALQTYWASLLAPPKGPRQSGIRAKFGLDDIPAAIQYSGTSLTKDAATLRLVLNYAISPREMDTLCALNKAALRECLSLATWQGSIVNTSALRPLGRRAFSHWRLWTRARAVIHGAWACSNVSLLMSGAFAPWRWRTRHSSPWLRTIDNKFVCVSHSPIPTSRVTVHLSAVGLPLCIGIIDTSSPAEIALACFGQSARHAFLGGVFLDCGRVLLCTGEDDAVAARLGLAQGCFVSVGCGAQELLVEANGKAVRAATRADLCGRYWFCAAAMSERVGVQPCWAL